MNGYEFRAAHQNDQALCTVPAIVRTARGAVDTNDIDVEVLHKPLKLAKLRDAIHRAVQAPPT